MVIITPNDITYIDSELSDAEKFVKGALEVYRVRYHSNDCVLKIAYPRDNWGVRHIENEWEVLDRAKRVSGITHGIKKYDCVFGSAILKEYFEGDMLYESVSSSVRHQLEKTVEDLHFLGIFNLNINGENTILSPSKRRAKIIDLGHCDIYSEDYGAISPDMFSNGKKRDLYDLGLLFG
ncbi:serine/threonine protein kinase [archaeon]|jgi:serine/threonine protein kinase|nr:serine/threonine protein kinase [archaeon]MBT7128792.1 serine/threonine protein kinase [archaeon]